MNKLLLGAAAAAALIAPGAAAAETNGYVAFSYNSLDDDFDTFKEDYLALGGGVVTSVSGDWNLQFDADIGDMNHGDHTDTFSTATVHIFTRNDSYAFGGFAGFTSDEASGWIIGAEGAAYLGRFSLAGSALIGANRESDDEIVNIGGTGTYFFTDNFSVGVDANWYEFDFSGGSQDGTIYGVNGEYQFAGTGFSVFAGYHASDEDYFGFDKENNTFTIGGRYNFGTPSLFARDRSGASMLGASQMTRTQIFAW